MIYENDAWNLSEEEKELRDEIRATADEAGNEEDEEAFQKIIDAVVLAKTFSPKENRIHRAEAVKNHGQLEVIFICQRRHN